MASDKVQVKKDNMSQDGKIIPFCVAAKLAKACPSKVCPTAEPALAKGQAAEATAKAAPTAEAANAKGEAAEATAKAEEAEKTKGKAASSTDAMPSEGAGDTLPLANPQSGEPDAPRAGEAEDKAEDEAAEKP